MQERSFVLTIVVSGLVALTASPALAATHQVGPGKPISTLSQLPALQPGDVVEIDGGASYGPMLVKANGTPAQKITIRGVRVGGKRPVLNGGTNTLDIAGSHVVIEGLDITGGSSRCVFHRANDVTLRDSVIHDCPNHGLLGADNGSGSLLMEYVEVHHTGLGDQKHQIYMATDEDAYPGSVFRMQFCYLHDGNGGHGVKSRAERNEIYYNWIEGSYYHELELIGPDPGSGAAEGKAREDSDVVGNVLRKTGAKPGFHAVRIGGDATGQTAGRYRFVNNTFLLGAGSGSAFRVFDRVDTLEAHNNVFYRVGGGSIELIRTSEAASPLPLVAGTNNWVSAGSAIPPDWQGTLTGADPAFAAVSSKDLRPLTSSPLIDKGGTALAGPAARPFPSPLPAPLFEPPAGQVMAVGTAVARQSAGTIDIGAYELGGTASPTPPSTTTPPAPPPSTDTTPPAPPATTEPTTPPSTPPPAPVTEGATGGTPVTTAPPATGGTAPTPPAAPVAGNMSAGAIPGVVGGGAAAERGGAGDVQGRACAMGGGGAPGLPAAIFALGLVGVGGRRRWWRR
jgi:hypothetical protein